MSGAGVDRETQLAYCRFGICEQGDVHAECCQRAWPEAQREISAPAAAAADECACFPGTCRGGEVVDGKLASGLRCKACKPHRAESST